MQSRFPRRAFLGGIAALGGAYAAAAFSEKRENRLSAKSPNKNTDRLKSPFRIAVINDEISQDFDRACHVAAREFGMEWMEVRGMWNKNIVALDSKETGDARRILDKYKLRVTDIASPLFKTDWPGAPKSKYSPAKPEFNADFSFAQQDEVLERALELAKQFGTDRVRCFDFWRLEDQAPYRAAMNDKLREGAMKAGKKNITLVLENELSCNTATGAEAAKVLSTVKSRWLMLNWDPGNAAARGEKPYPDGYSLLPKERIGHCHCKDVARKSGDDDYWAKMGSGIVDWLG
ncbi:MAG TPA: sugar phosphate isomerase/epimerase family protein, partial [Terriglobales bacterium]|nr:sugar phosphate isomerase/epimerase family protein [Terriglobales bacterium]